ncbi:hypothetical protein PAP_08190 [Palaeococcus pacificus DY20341]|uniref:Aminotransferase n=1 Tax=Palaeococcus pacificus DY20341 TaxID=1343739 RepID=A0A075LV54_9EURY|nr:amylo-alpha-1,6-glucosidase [Palaeococcus pacificus]AIF70026.1 hypothetical protein PAP_08190 [Palaeococcus pacificus DY20341]
MTRVILSSNGAFVVSDVKGDMNGEYHGFYAFDTRFVSDISLEVEHYEKQLLGHVELASHASISHMLLKSGKSSILLVRKRELAENWTYREVLTFYNLSHEPKEILINYLFKISFDDIFEVRRYPGITREIKFEEQKDGRKYYYSGIDGVKRELIAKSTKLVPNESGFMGRITLDPLRSEEVEVIFYPKVYQESLQALLKEKLHFKLDEIVKTSSSKINEVFRIALKDLSALTVSTAHGVTIFAGVPFFVSLFGRDSIITSLFLLPYFPEYAEGTLRILSRLQGKAFDSMRGEEPGKILHEFRFSELSQGGRLPFNLYYGTIDATPLYLILAGEYLKWTGDYETIRELKESLNKAVEWLLAKIEEGDGYVRYSSLSLKGLRNQGWKDSTEGIPDEDGKPTQHPVALVEVQGYAYKALLDMAELSDVLDVNEKLLKSEASKLKRRFNRDFWMKKEKFYAIALSGENKPSKVISSNPGHLLFTGIAEHEKEIAQRLFERDMFSGWGIRTLSSKEKAYNPFSYHNGSVWPHDNAIIALGLSKVGEREKAALLGSTFLKAGTLLPNFQMPELFSGVESEVPLIVPRANVPQAWSAASLFAFLTAMLGAGVENGDLRISPTLPKELGKVEVVMKFHGEKVVIGHD